MKIEVKLPGTTLIYIGFDRRGCSKLNLHVHLCTLSYWHD